MRFSICTLCFLLLLVYIPSCSDPAEATTSSEQHFHPQQDSGTITVTFDTDNGTIINPQIIENNGIAKRPENPKKENYEFINWYTDKSFSTIFDFSTPITKNITLYAFFMSTEAVSPNADGSYTVTPYNLKNTLASIPEDVINVTIRVIAEINIVPESNTRSVLSEPIEIDFNSTIMLYHKIWKALISFPNLHITLDLSEATIITQWGPYYCPSNVFNITLPPNINYISPQVFDLCYNLQTIHITNTNSFYKTIDNILYAENGTVLHTYPQGKTDKSYTISNTVTSINDNAFANCKNLTSISMPDSVKIIGERAFEGCTNLKDINISNSVTKIENYAFSNCQSLVSIHIPDSVQTIGGGAFKGCTNLENINISNSVTSIESYTFENCKSLLNINIPKQVKSIGSYAFLGCSSIETLFIPNSVENISDGAFSDCMQLKAVSIGNGLDTIPNSTFTNCISLEDVNMGTEMKYINENAFAYCKKLKYISLPSQIKAIHDTAFIKCAIEQVVYAGNLLQWLQIEHFPETLLNYMDKSIFGSIITIPDDLQNIRPEAFYKFTDITNVVLGKNITYIGDDAFAYCEKLESVTINDSLKEIRDGAFAHCANLKNITFSKNIQSIGKSSFERCTNLEQLTIPSNVKTIGANAFLYCYNLKNLVFENTDSWYSYSNSDYTLDETKVPANRITIENLTQDTFLSNRYLKRR